MQVKRGLRGMLRWINTRYGTAATCAVMLTLALAQPGDYAFADSRQPTAESHHALPDAAAVAEAFFLARGWVDSFEPPSIDDPSSRIRIENATGVCVILRSARRVVGTGVAAVGADSEPDLMLRRAVGRALADVLGDPAVAALPQERRDEIGTLLTLELEIAGSFQPLLGRDFHRIAQQLEPGLDGVAMRRGDARAMIFPAQLRSVNAAGNIQSRLPGLATELGLTTADLAALQQRHNVSMHRFRTTHLTQDAPARFPFETFRGDRLVNLNEVTNDSLATFADGIAAHLIGRLWNTSTSQQVNKSTGETVNKSTRQHVNKSTDIDGGDAPSHRLTASPSQSLALGMKGDYDPIGDTFRPIVAPPLDQALAAYALMRYAAARLAHGKITGKAREAAITVLVDLETVEEGEIDPLLDPAACAVIVMTLAEHRDLAREDEAIERLGRGAMKVVSESFDPQAGYSVNDRFVPPHTQALLAAAIATRLLQEDAAPEDAELEYARAAIDAVWTSVPHQQHVTLLPWIGWAEMAYARASGSALANTGALRTMRSALEEARELESADLEPDLQGGFPLVLDAAGGTRPNAQSSRPAAFFATMLREPALTRENERVAAQERHRETMRFLVQLSVRESTTWSMRSPDAAVGGLRAALWDSRMPTAAQAMALLAAVETLYSTQ